MGFERARIDDVYELLELYRKVYGRGYALPLGTDPQVMGDHINSPDTTWLVGRAQGRVVASILATRSSADRLAKMQGLVVDPDRRGSGVAQQAVRSLADALLDSGEVDSVYATARTTATAPQRICLRAGFRGLGIFPNQRKAAKHETMVLLARHQDGVLEQRVPVARVPIGLGPIMDALDSVPGMPVRPKCMPSDIVRPRTARAAGGDIELVSADRFVLRRFDEVLTDPARRFYPFHQPNVLLAGPDGDYEVYAHLSPADGYCALIGAVPSAGVVTEHLDQIIARLAESGAHHVETLVPLDAFDGLSALLAHGFLPAAVYPAMRREADGFHDYVVMTRTMQPLDFRGLAMDAAFRPFAEQYISQWTQMYLNTQGVFR
ncbi:acetyltransferase (GNAT) family protein [Herbihabitans rhizosphaerae]|uniref:Acetyltransferase (GNAT) family protein n=1 Tax=Herbihabitans rhizosphaerae TaxID=1872711 RepID=A0A4V2EU75_9PSEU|nr:GNAT family N-acetyltransferase [Herbihabitans rhizosphaerae]RZS43593.1 acetyltransferase (GNAT) family protein [Herbihabitans rhizosphaerae]